MELLPSALIPFVEKRLEELAIPHPGSPGDVVTVSIGASVVRSSPHASVEQVIAAADKALYQAKARGRNRVARSVDRLGETVHPIRKKAG